MDEEVQSPVLERLMYRVYSTKNSSTIVSRSENDPFCLSVSYPSLKFRLRSIVKLPDLNNLDEKRSVMFELGGI
ncbi:hypothetical protein HZH66_009071 [Vespula vulgaris]|uniref:Uncharacterized protein n=1 Tax=Vespula vulgaris TaxID=7454 RepID=A0A834JQT6_VESVU|nr:hypothetical protein HZH66_009071 [Vespula vulgaris]